ncbi:MAG: hypothetical protein ACFFB5_05630 [Promethearchaeota archaeon]
MIKIESLEEERLIYSIIASDTPKTIKDILFNAIEEFEEQRAI